MDIKHFLDKVCNEIKYEPVKTEISEELKLHIQEIKEDYQKQGIEEKEAEEKAVSQMGVAEDIGRKLNKIHKPKLDWKLLILTIILSGFGITIAVLKQDQIVNKIIWLIFGTIMGIIVYFLDYTKIKNYSTFIYVIATIITIMPRLNNINNIETIDVKYLFCTVSVPLYIISITGFLSNYNKEKKWKIVQNNDLCNVNININIDLLKIIVFSIVSLIILYTVPSLANTLLLGLIYIALFLFKFPQYFKCKRKQILISFGLIGCGFVVLMVYIGLLSPYRMQRWYASIHPEIDPNGSGYVGMLRKDIIKNKKMIGSADSEAIKDMNGVIKNLDIYSFIYLLGKIGIVASSLVVFAIIAVSIKVILNVKCIKEEYGKMLNIGLGLLFILQSVISLLMNFNIGIDTNINLPFISYNEVNIIVSIIEVAIILNIYRRKDIILIGNKDESSKIKYKIGD